MTKTSVIPDSLSASIPHLVACGHSRESKDQIPDSDFIKISPDPVPTLTHCGRCGQLHQAIKILSRCNVIALCVSEIISDWKCWLHFSSSSVSQISALHRDIMTPVSRLMLVSSPLIAADNGSALHRLIITRLKPTHADNKMERAPDSHDQSMETHFVIQIFSGFVCLSEQQRICNK